MIVFKMLKSGAFVAGDTETRLTAYAFPSSPNADRAKRCPKATASEMMAHENTLAFAHKTSPDYDASNWKDLTS